MRAKILFQTPFGAEAALEITLFEQQCPQAVRNFLFCLNGHLIAADARAQQEQTIGGPTPAPLLGTKLLRYMPSESIEFGTSATRSMYGGFFADELLCEGEPSGVSSSTPSNPKAGRAITSSQTCLAGALLSMNIGPHTNASKYLLLLQDDISLRGSHVQLGQAVDLKPLIALLSKVKSQPRTYALNPGVTLAQVAVARSEAATTNRGPAPPRAPRGKPMIRGRDDEAEENDHHHDHDHTDHNNNNHDAADSSLGRDRKRRRGETVVFDEATGEQKMISTAIPTEVGKTFNLFEAQSIAFANNLDSIREVQKQRMHNRNRKDSKAKHFKTKAKQARGKRY